MYLTDIYLLHIFFVFLCLIPLLLIGYILYMDNNSAQELVNELIHKPIINPPPLLSDWVYLNLDQGTPYLDENRYLRTVGHGQRLRLIMDMYDPTGTVVNSAVHGLGQVTVGLNGQQVCGMLIYKRGGYVYGFNNQIKCKVDIARVLALRQTYDLTTDNLPLSVVGNMAHISRYPVP